MCLNCSVAKKKSLVFGCGAFFILLSLIVGLIWPLVAKHMLQSELELKKGSLNYNNWVETPIPMYFQIHMFNWTNPHQIHDPNVKPNLVELGPYVFLEKHTRVDIDWHPENETVSYNQIRTWHFLPELSNGTLDDQITSVNVITSAAAFKIRKSNSIIKMFANYMLNRFGSLTATKSVREWLYDGYDDPLLDFLKSLNTSRFDIPFKRFGWFVERNNSKTYDGHFEMTTGESDVNRMGQLTMWNYHNRTKFYHDGCSTVKGTSGELWPPNMNATGDITLFVTDVCRPLTLAYQEPYESFGVTGSKWVGDYRVFDNGQKYPPNLCYCTGDRSSCPDLLPGVQNVSDCLYGAPAFVSFPHFYLADPSYAQAVSGLKPNRSEHEFIIALEPHTGIPLDIKARLQINLHLQPIKGLDIFAKVPNVMIPTFWFSQMVHLNEDLARDAKMAIELPSVGVYAAYGFTGLGIILVAVGAVVTLTKSWNRYTDLDDELSR